MSARPSSADLLSFNAYTKAVILNMYYWGIGNSKGQYVHTNIHATLDTGYHYTRQQLDQFPDPDEAHARRGAYWTFDGAAFVDKMHELHAKGMKSCQ